LQEKGEINRVLKVHTNLPGQPPVEVTIQGKLVD
jgi:hypothetical protein